MSASARTPKPPECEVVAAVRRSRNHRLALALRSGQDPNVRGRDGLTPLLLSAKCGRLLCVEILLTAASIDDLLTDASGNTPLMLAARHGHTDCVRALLAHRRAYPNVANHQGNTPLSCAAMRGHHAALILLLRNGSFEINHQNKQHHTALMLAAISGSATCVAELLRVPDIDPNIATPVGKKSALHLAVLARNLDSARELCQSHRVMVNGGTNPRKWSPLDDSIFSRQAPFVKLLLKRPDINLWASHGHGMSAIERAAVCHSPKILKKVLKAVLASDADVIARHTDEIVLAWLNAVDASPVECLREFLRIPGMHVNVRFKEYGESAIHCAVRDARKLEWLLSIPELDINARDGLENTALIRAAEGNRAEAVEALLAHPDIDVDAVNRFGDSALDIFARRLNREISIHSGIPHSWVTFLPDPRTEHMRCATALIQRAGTTGLVHTASLPNGFKTQIMCEVECRARWGVMDASGVLRVSGAGARRCAVVSALVLASARGFGVALLRQNSQVCM